MKITQLMKIRKVFNERANEKISVSLAYKMMKFVKASDSEDAFYTAELQKIIEQYAERDTEGKIVSTQGGVKLSKENLPACNEAIDKLNDCSVEIPNISFTIEELGELKLSMSEIYVLDELIKEE